MYFNEHKHSLKTYLLFENIKARLYKNNIQLKKKSSWNFHTYVIP